MGDRLAKGTFGRGAAIGAVRLVVLVFIVGLAALVAHYFGLHTGDRGWDVILFVAVLIYLGAAKAATRHLGL